MNDWSLILSIHPFDPRRDLLAFRNIYNPTYGKDDKSGSRPFLFFIRSAPDWLVNLAICYVFVPIRIVVPQADANSIPLL